MNKLTRLKELLAAMSLYNQFQAEIVQILEEYEQELYSLKEDNKRLLAAVRKLDDQSKKLNNKYSELLYKLSELK